MKRWLSMLLVGLLLLLSGCSYLNITYDTLDYVKDAKSYLYKAASFAEETPPLLKQAVDSRQAADDLKAKLQQMKEDLQTFNNLNVPVTVSDFHQQIIDQNNLLLDQIDIYLNHIQYDNLAPSILDDTELLKPIQEITNTIEQIEKLGAQVSKTLNTSHGA